MPITIGSNIASLKSQRGFAESSFELSKSFERLSSGSRLNSAADDAAGLAVAANLNSKTRVYTQAGRNLGDGQSLLTIADSTVSQLSDIVTRLQELAQQAANGPYSNKQRAALDKEAQSLSKEYFRISRSAQFNNINLFDGTLNDGIRVQAGYGVDGSIFSRLGGALGTGTFQSSITYSSGSGTSNAVAVGDLNGDGKTDLVTAGSTSGFDGYITIRLGNGDGTFASSNTYAAETNTSNAVALKDLNDDGILDLITAGGNDGVFDGYANVRFGRGDGTFGSATSYLTEARVSYGLELGDIDGDGRLDLITAGYDDANDGFITVRLGQSGGTFGTATSYSNPTQFTSSVTAADLNNDGNLDLLTTGNNAGAGVLTVRLGNGNGGFGAATSYASESGNSYAVEATDLNGDGILDLVSVGAGGGGYASVRLGNGNGTFGTRTSYLMTDGTANSLALGDVNGDGNIDILAAGTDNTNSYGSIRLGNSDGTFGNRTTFTTNTGTVSLGLVTSDLNRDGVLDFITVGSNAAASIHLSTIRDGISPLVEFSLRTSGDARQAIPVFGDKLTQLSQQRGIIGAFQSRLNSASSTVQSSRDNYSAAESRIRDVDVAAESSELSRLQILQQAGTAVLAQANIQPRIALKLLSP